MVATEWLAAACATGGFMALTFVYFIWALLGAWAVPKPVQKTRSGSTKGGLPAQSSFQPHLLVCLNGFS